VDQCFFVGKLFWLFCRVLFLFFNFLICASRFNYDLLGEKLFHLSLRGLCSNFLIFLLIFCVFVVDPDLNWLRGKNSLNYVPLRYFLG
jgi:hypothetical protein